MNTYFRTGVVTLLLGFSLTACHEAKKSDTSAESTAVSVSWIFSRMMNS